MAKRKVIEDSDDEDNVETTPPKRPRVGSSEVGSNSISTAEDGQGQGSFFQSAGPSTGSTELLTREIHAAHQSLITPTPDGSLPSTRNGYSSRAESQAPPSTSGLKLKRAKTMVDKPRVKTPLKKHGTESSKDIDEFHGDSDVEVESCTKRREVPRQTASSWAMSSGDTLILESTDLIRAGFTSEGRDMAGTESLLPPGSKSTSFEQTQESEADTHGTTREQDTIRTHSKAKTVEETILWKSLASDDQMPTTIMSSHQSDAKSTRNRDNLEKSRERLSFDADTAKDQTAEPTSSASSFSLNETIAVERRDLTSGNPAENEVLSEDESFAFLPVRGTLETINPTVLLKDDSQAFEENDELSLPTHGPETWSINQTTCSEAQKRRRDNQLSQSKEPDSDDVGIGLPKDHYQPRPSRSRSGRGTEEIITPVDFSKRPEKAAKKRQKLFKSKTTAFHELLPLDEDQVESDNRQLEPEEEDHLNVSETDGAFSRPKSPPQELTSSPPPNLVEGPTEANLGIGKRMSDVGYESVSDLKPPNHRSKAKKQRGRPKKVTPISTSDENPPSVPLVAPTQGSDTKPEMTDKKARKGRKTKSVPMPLNEDLVHDSDDELEDVDDKIQERSTTLEEIRSTYVSPKAIEKAVRSLSSATASMSVPTTPRKVESVVQKGPDKHSPISGGQVAYRVGLSKRARIAPLLRMVRKT